MAKNKGKGKGRKNHGPNPVAALNNHQLNHLANQILHPIQSQANHQAQAAQGFGAALANIYGGIAPQVQSAYSNAADKTAGYANGFSTGLQLLQQNGGNDAAARLAQQGAPVEQQQQVQGVGQGGSDALYGAGGYLPASSLQHEGAGWAAAAAQAPKYAGRQAQMDSTRLRMEALQQIAQQRPQIMQMLRDFELQKYAARINAGYLQNARAGTRIDQFNAVQGAKHDQQALNQANKGDKQEFWQDTRKDILSKAEDMASREIPNPNPFGSSDTIVQPLPYKVAFGRLMQAFGKELMRKGFSRAKVKKLIDESLRANGIKPHKVKPPGHVGGSQLPHD